jgi:hypothetical protein
MAPLRPDLVNLIGFTVTAMVLSMFSLIVVTMLIRSFGWWSFDLSSGHFHEED